MTETQRYTMQAPSYYHRMMRGTSLRLFHACWRQYRAYLNGAIDSPTSDADVLSWLESIASERVNNSRSSFYIHGN